MATGSERSSAEPAQRRFHRGGLRSLRFLRNLPRDNRQFAVIGLGRFGQAVCQSLYRMGYQVLGTDRDEALVSQALGERMASHAIRFDATDSGALREAGIFEFDTVVVAIGHYLQESIVTTLNVKEAGVPYVVAKASSATHGKLLDRVGADHVVYPEREAGQSLAYELTKPEILARFDLDPDNSIVEVLVPRQFDGKTIAELQLRNRYGVTAIALSDGDKFDINPGPNQPLREGTAMVVVGANRDIQRLPKHTKAEAAPSERPRDGG